MNRPTPDPSQEGSRHRSVSCTFPSWEGLGVGSWSQCMRKSEGRLSMSPPLSPGQILRLGSAELRLESRPTGEPVRVAVPEMKVEEPPSSATLADGSLSCLNHGEVRAIVKCVKCQRAFCEDCVHVLGLAGGKTRIFCPSCSGPCELLPGAVAPGDSLKPKKQSLFGRLTQTIRIHLK